MRIIDYPSLFWNPGRIHFDADNGLVYSDDGFHVINPSTGLPIGIVELGGGWPLAPDSNLDTIFSLAQYMWKIESPNYTIDHFSNFQQVAIFMVSKGLPREKN